MQDADFVINTASVVTYRSGLETRDLIQKFGYDWDGPGTLEYSFYNSSFILEVAREIEEICPDAWLIQSGNPVYDGCTAIGRETDVKVCGLCHGYYGYRDICNMLEIDHTKVTWQAPGLNHNIWLTQFEYEGKDAYPLIDEWIESRGEEYWAETAASRGLPTGKTGWSARVDTGVGDRPVAGGGAYVQNVRTDAARRHGLDEVHRMVVPQGFRCQALLVR